MGSRSFLCSSVACFVLSLRGLRFVLWLFIRLRLATSSKSQCSPSVVGALSFSFSFWLLVRSSLESHCSSCCCCSESYPACVCE